MRAGLALLLVVALSGCRTVAEVPQDLDAAQAYQLIANQLPRADWGWGESPPVARMGASERGAPDPPQIELSCNETCMTIPLEVLHRRAVTIPYTAIEEISSTY